MDERTHIFIAGVGGIGANHGARLQRAGHEFIFVARGRDLQTLCGWFM